MPKEVEFLNTIVSDSWPKPDENLKTVVDAALAIQFINSKLTPEYVGSINWDGLLTLYFEKNIREQIYLPIQNCITLLGLYYSQQLSIKPIESFNTTLKLAFAFSNSYKPNQPF
ncbi:MAG: hypothetical protein AAGG80_01040, partial [Pseudomonadota bacterium]